MNKHYKIFFIISIVLIIIFTLKVTQNNISENKLKEVSIHYQAKALADFLISFRKIYQDIFIQNHINLDKTTIDFLPVKTTNKIAELFSKNNEYTKFSTVSDRPRNLVNMANKRQLEVIKVFKENKKLQYSFKNIDNKYYYSQPLYINKQCLNCHGKKEDAPKIIRDNYDVAYNYKLGDLRGIIDIELEQTEVSELLTKKGEDRMVFISIFLSIIIFVLYIYTKYIIKLDLQKDEQHEKETLDILLHSLPMAVIGYNENREVVYWNKTSEALYGYKFSDLKNTKYEELLGSDDEKSDIIKSIDNWYNDGTKILPREVTFIKKDETTIFVYSTYLMVLRKDGEKIIFSMDIDLTGQKESQKKDIILAEQSKMVSMGEMIGNIAHQWRQPLSVISTASTGMILQKEYGNLTDEVLVKNCNSINDNAQYLSKTIDDFRNFIKGDRTKKLFNLEEDINSFLQLIDGRLKSNNIMMVLDINKNIQIDGYENELIQCFMNIVNNSKDALVDNNIKDKFIFISTSIQDDHVLISIKDNAGGIDTDVLPKIFEPYFTTKHQSQGTGLGLHMTYNLICDGMGGTIEANNSTYKYKNKEFIGAEFIISLPKV